MPNLENSPPYVRGELEATTEVLLDSVIRIGGRLIVAKAHGDLGAVATQLNNPFFVRLAMEAAQRAHDLRQSGTKPEQVCRVMQAEGWLSRIVPHIECFVASGVFHGA